MYGEYVLGNILGDFGKSYLFFLMQILFNTVPKKPVQTLWWFGHFLCTSEEEEENNNNNNNKLCFKFNRPN